MDGSATIAGVVTTTTGVFFLWKLWTGWLVINLRVELKTARMSRRDKSDLLAVTVILDKGATDTLRVTSVALRAVPVLNGSGGAGPVVFEWTGLAPQLYHTRGAHGPEWDKTKGYSELTLSPGERTEFGAAHQVLAGQPYFVEVVVLGYRPFWQRGFQWRASTISLPVDREPINARDV